MFYVCAIWPKSTSVGLAWSDRARPTGFLDPGAPAQLFGEPLRIPPGGGPLRGVQEGRFISRAPGPRKLRGCVSFVLAKWGTSVMSRVTRVWRGAPTANIPCAPARESATGPTEREPIGLWASGIRDLIRNFLLFAESQNWYFSWTENWYRVRGQNHTMDYNIRTAFSNSFCISSICSLWLVYLICALILCILCVAGMTRFQVLQYLWV